MIDLGRSKQGSVFFFLKCEVLPELPPDGMKSINKEFPKWSTIVATLEGIKFIKNPTPKIDAGQ